MGTYVLVKVNLSASLQTEWSFILSNLTSMLSEPKDPEGAISTALHSAFTPLENKNSYIKKLFVDLSIQSCFFCDVATKVSDK